MSVSHEVYIGCYCRVWMPKEKAQESVGICSGCKKTQHTAFCPICGNRVDFAEVEVLRDFYGFCEQVLGAGNGDRYFDVPHKSTDEYLIVIVNLASQPGSLHIEEAGEFEIPKSDFGGAWLALTQALDEHGIRYERHFGIVSYYW